MPKPRKSLISLDVTPYYHCVSRCVRRTFLCGTDALTGRSYEHRRGWVEQRLLELPRHFAIEVSAYAVMSNHAHLVLHINAQQAAAWSTTEVIERWHGLFSGHPLTHRFLRGETESGAEQADVEEIAREWRQRLSSISWFMRCLNEPIARQANEEDQCSGRFWEGRYKSQALLDEAAVMACMAYVDLNPVRAKMADTPEASDHTSIQRRIRALEKPDMAPEEKLPQPAQLQPFVGYPREPMPEGLPFRLHDYLTLVDWTGRCLREDKRGTIDQALPPILERLHIEAPEWMEMTSGFEERFKTLVGNRQRIDQACEQLGQRWAHGTRACERLMPG
ncbi:MAG: transposase [gamma proteobacterium symbiont of Phacoides pectinatus]